jgi:hypothetical protein
VPVFLCTFHVLKAWLEQLRHKVKDKARYTEAFQALRGIMYQVAAGSFEERMAVIDGAIALFKKQFEDEKALLAYLTSTWEHKRGTQLLTCSCRVPQNMLNYSELEYSHAMCT